MTGSHAFSINPAVCMDAHLAIDAAARRIRELLEEIDHDGERLLAGWDGDAQEAFHARQRQWHADADTILTKLQQINAGLQRAVQIYVQADKRGVDLITGA
ncbi:MAG TPA: WXG100 family type VII secretion target [Micromonosporaceae bacterium]|jgi:early secretory antigenic target protein ESAT-6